MLPRGFTCDRLDTANAGRDATFAYDGNESDVPGTLDMRATAQLHGPTPYVAALSHRYNAHLIAVFLSEERPSTRLHSIFNRQNFRIDRGVLFNDLVSEILH